MSIDTNLPMELYKANVQLWLNMGLLLQEARQQWADLGDKALEDDVEETRKELEDLSRASDWKDLTNLPGSTAWRRMQKRVGDAQACTETAIAEQTRFVAGMQHALADWQKSLTRAVSDAGKSLPMGMPMSGAVPDFSALMKMFTPPAGGSGAKATGKGKNHAS
ncbi:phasin family protein [Dyella ginsengisoli]|uniref:phasin family protein n=1 Tax=Dyella ginsengisoli TaxID=363848 RepID=UPI0012FE30F9|nr:phasin family protein [Dyella ginsengisoli]